MDLSTDKEDQKLRTTKAYDQGRTNFEEGKRGPNPYYEETESWYDWEFGWGDATIEAEILKGKKDG